MNTLYSSFYNTKKATVTIDRKKLSEHMGVKGLKYFLVIGYLRKHLQSIGNVKLSLNELILGCGGSLTYRAVSKYKDYRNIIKELSENKLVNIQADIDKVKPSTYFDIICTKELFEKKNNFVVFNVYEFDKIIGFADGSISKAALVGVYLYVKQFITLKPDLSYGNYFVFPSLSDMSADLGISVKTCRYALKELVDIGLLFCLENFYIEEKSKKNYYVPTRCTYALDKKYLVPQNVKNAMADFYGRPVYEENEVLGNIIFL